MGDLETAFTIAVGDFEGLADGGRDGRRVGIADESIFVLREG